MRRDWRRFLTAAAILGLAVLGAAGCGKANREDSGRTETAAESEEPGTAQSGTEKESGTAEEEPAVIEEFQIVPGYGIVVKNNPQVYIMSNEDMPSVWRDKLAVELESVVYQDGQWLVRTRVQDFSAEILSKEESARIAGAFCIDETNQQYARSLYNDEYGQNISGSMLLTGTGLPDSGVRFHSYGASYDYSQLEAEGSITYLNEARAENMKPEQQAPEGTYELKIAGFDEPLKFQLKPAKTCERITDLEGGSDIDGLSVVVQKKAVGNLLGISWMTVESDPYQLRPQTFDPEKKVVLRGEKGEYQLTKSQIPSWGMNYDLKGLTKSGQQRALWFDVPEDEQGESFTLLIPGIIMNERTRAQPVVIPVPKGEEAPLSVKVEFNGCTLSLTHVKKMPEPMKTGMMAEATPGDGTADAEIKKPALYITADLESRDPKKEAVTVTGYEEDSSAQPYERQYLQNDSQEGEPVPYGRLKGFYVFYDEGDSQIPVSFADPVYFWHKDIELPVQ